MPARAPWLQRSGGFRPAPLPTSWRCCMRPCLARIDFSTKRGRSAPRCWSTASNRGARPRTIGRLLCCMETGATTEGMTMTDEHTGEETLVDAALVPDPDADD